MYMRMHKSRSPVDAPLLFFAGQVVFCGLGVCVCCGRVVRWGAVQVVWGCLLAFSCGEEGRGEDVTRWCHEVEGGCLWCEGYDRWDAGCGMDECLG